MPATAFLKLGNHFGNAYLGDLKANLTADISYGNLETGKLDGKQNDLKLSFGDFEIDNMISGKINVEYSSLELGRAGFLDLESSFSEIELGEVSEFILDSQYDGIELGSVDIISGEASFTGIEIGEVFNKIDLISSYGGIEIDRVSGSFSSIDIHTEFGGVKLGISSSASYKLDASASFGDIDFPESKAEIMKLKKESFKQEIEAFIGDDKASKSTVKLYAANCDIDIN